MLTIYVASSFRNMHAVCLFQSALQSLVPDITILDWTSKATPPDGLTPQARRTWFDTEQHVRTVYQSRRVLCLYAYLFVYFVFVCM